MPKVVGVLCDICKTVLKNKQNYQIHLKTKHQNWKKQCHKCLCNISAKNHNIQTHEKNCFSKMFKCHICGKKYFRYSRFVDHYADHLESDRKINLADIESTYKSSLKNLIKCPNCPNAYASKSSFNVHTKRCQMGPIKEKKSKLINETRRQRSKKTDFTTRKNGKSQNNQRNQPKEPLKAQETLTSKSGNLSEVEFQNVSSNSKSMSFVDENKSYDQNLVKIEDNTNEDPVDLSRHDLSKPKCFDERLEKAVNFHKSSKISTNSTEEMSPKTCKKCLVNISNLNKKDLDEHKQTCFSGIYWCHLCVSEKFEKIDLFENHYESHSQKSDKILKFIKMKKIFEKAADLEVFSNMENPSSVVEKNLLEKNNELSAKLGEALKEIAKLKEKNLKLVNFHDKIKVVFNEFIEL